MSYLDRRAAFEDEVYAVVPEVAPDERWHDGWDGAAGAECRGESYEPYPHRWDSTLLWCQLRFGDYYGENPIEGIGRPIERIPGWIVRRALPYADTRYR